MYWAIGVHLGTPLSQNPLGEMIGRVREERRANGQRSASGTKSREDLAMHTDNAEIFTLLCVRQAKEGGNTQFVSALAIHNEILKTHPEVLPVLYNGFPYHRRGRQPPEQAAITPYNVPVFCNVNGMVSVQYVVPSIMAALQALGRKPTDEEINALGVFQDIAERLLLDVKLAPGELSAVNNFTMVHSRSEYVDWDEPDQRRLLLRLWLEAARNRRPVPHEIHYYENVGGRSGVDPVPGRTGSAAEFYNMPDELLEVIKQAQQKRRASA